MPVTPTTLGLGPYWFVDLIYMSSFTRTEGLYRRARSEYINQLLKFLFVSQGNDIHIGQLHSAELCL